MYALFAPRVHLRFESGTLVYAFVKRFYNVHMNPTLYAQLKLTREGSCAFGACFIAWVLNYVDGDNVRASKQEFWSRARAQQLAEGLQRARVLSTWACADAEQAPRSSVRYGKIIYSNPYTEARLHPHWRALIFPLVADPQWCISKSDIVVLYLRLVHEMTFSIPLSDAAARAELRSDNNVALSDGVYADEFTTRSPVFSGSLLTYEMIGADVDPRVSGGGEHLHTMSAMQTLLAQIMALDMQFVEEIVRPLLVILDECAAGTCVVPS